MTKVNIQDECMKIHAKYGRINDVKKSFPRIGNETPYKISAFTLNNEWTIN